LALQILAEARRAIPQDSPRVGHAVFLPILAGDLGDELLGLGQGSFLQECTLRIRMRQEGTLQRMRCTVSGYVPCSTAHGQDTRGLPHWAEIRGARTEVRSVVHATLAVMRRLPRFYRWERQPIRRVYTMGWGEPLRPNTWPRQGSLVFPLSLCAAAPTRNCAGVKRRCLGQPARAVICPPWNYIGSS
jgi:hypothetical protein